MTGRPCKPDADFKRLWQRLLPGTPFPACGMPDEPGAGAAGTVGPPPRQIDHERDSNKALGRPQV